MGCTLRERLPALSSILPSPVTATSPGSLPVFVTASPASSVRGAKLLCQDQYLVQLARFEGRSSSPPASVRPRHHTGTPARRHRPTSANRSSPALVPDCFLFASDQPARAPNARTRGLGRSPTSTGRHHPQPCSPLSAYRYPHRRRVLAER